MAKFSDRILASHQEFIKKQHLFFVATSPLMPEGHINLSPKGTDSFKVIHDKEVMYLDLTGSGNETAAHLTENGRITFMFCSFDKVPLILRLYGKGRIVLPDDPAWDECQSLIPLKPGTRQYIRASIEQVQTSCGYGVPVFTYQHERGIYDEWTRKMGEEKLQAYIREKNQVSIDGLPIPVR